MNDKKQFEQSNVLLSREELLLLLNLLQADDIPGLEIDPFGELNDDQRQLAIIWAGRALRARELAQLNEDGKLMVQEGLLTAVGTCAYADKAIFAFHWHAGSKIASPYFGHIRGNNVVAHTRPEDVLHLFTTLPSQKELLSQLLDFCGYENMPSASSQPLEMKVTNDVFVLAREAADGDENEKAVALLVDNGAGKETAVALTSTLTNAPNISILQTFKNDENNVAQKNDVTIIYNDICIWFVSPIQGTKESTLLFKVINKNEIENILISLL